jgi:ribosomal protein S6
MKERLKTISRIAELIGHRKEVLELQVLQSQKKLNSEQSQLDGLKDQLQSNIKTFEEGLQSRGVLNSLEISDLYESAHFFFIKIEMKNQVIAEINRELRAQRAVLLEAYKKDKVFGLFKNKMVFQETREEDLQEQKSLDYLNLMRRAKR